MAFLFGFFCFGDSLGAGVHEALGAPQSRDPARPQAGESPLEHHNSTLILIESGYCYFYQKPQYFWAFSRLKADLGSSRNRPFLRLWGFQLLPVRLGFVGLFPGFVEFMG